MTEETRDRNFWRSEDPLEVLASDLWSTTKAHSSMTNEDPLEAWKQAVSVLHDFGKLAETLRNDALLLAVTDAKGRAEEEFDRAFDRLSRAEGEQIRPYEEEWLKRLLRRSDALTDAYYCVEDHEPGRVPHTKAQMLEVLDELKREASEAFSRYKLEIGLED
jgi:hypothetical protein